MSNVLQIQDKLRENTALIARLEKSLAVHQSRETAASLRSLYKLNHVYEEEFKATAAADLVDVISYRIFDGLKQPTMALVGKALDSFQTLYAVMYAAISSGKSKPTAYLSPEVVANTSFQFGYTYSGSLGFVFTLPNEKLLFGETKLDEAMATLFILAKSDSTETIRDFGRKFGLAPVRAIYRWASALTPSYVGIDIRWQREDFVKGEILLQPAEVQALKDWIEATSDLETSENDIAGVLLGYDSAVHTFRLDPAEGSIIRGPISKEAKVPDKPVIHGAYIARVRTTTKIRYAIDRPEVNHELLALYEPE